MIPGVVGSQRVRSDAPAFTSSAAVSVDDGEQLSHSLTTNLPCTFAITGGLDAAELEISGSTLRWAGNGTQSFASPADDGSNNVYDCEVTATAISSGLTATQNIAVTVLNPWTTAFEFTPDAEHGSYGNMNTRQRLLRTFDAAGTNKLRVTFIAGLTQGLAVAAASIGHQAGSGNTYDYSGDQVQLTFNSGSASFSISAGQTIVSDEATFSFALSDDLIIALLHQNTTSYMQDFFEDTGNNELFSKATASDETMTSDVSGYSFNNYVTAGVYKIEVMS